MPPGEVTVAVEYSTLNYKDGMILEGVGRLVRKYPHVPGVDFAGTVESSTSPEWKPGDEVILTGWRVGEMQWGGYAEKARVKAGQLVRLPAGDHRQARDGDRHRRLHRDAGGHGARAARARSRRGRGAGDRRRGRGRQRRGGAAGAARPSRRRLDRTARNARLSDRASAPRPSSTARSWPKPPARPLDRERWAGAIDAVGGTTLATVLTQLKYRGERRGLRAGRRQRSADDGHPVPAARGQSARHRLGHVPARSAAKRPGSGWPRDLPLDRSSTP